jgi:hypothetical protein
MKPHIQNKIGLALLSRLSEQVNNQAKILIPVGIAIIIVAAVK